MEEEEELLLETAKDAEYPDASTIEWVVMNGLPDAEGLELKVENANAKTVEQMREWCELHEECVGFSFNPSEGRWYPKKKGTGFNAQTAKYTQPYSTTTWEWHYIAQRADGADVSDVAAVYETKEDGEAVNAMAMNSDVLEELELQEEQIEQIQSSWTAFIEAQGSQELAGDAIFSGIFESAPALQSMFTSARAVQSLRFMTALGGLVNALRNPTMLRELVETVAFGHMTWDINESKLMVFRDAVIDVLAFELDKRFTPAASSGWKSLITYAGGAFVFVKSRYAHRFSVLASSWKLVSADASSTLTGIGETAAVTEPVANQAQAENKLDDKKKGANYAWIVGGKSKKKTTKTGDASQSPERAQQQLSSNQQNMNVPTNYPDMFRFNAAVMGFGTQVWFREVLDCFDNIVNNVTDSTRLQQECDVLALRITNVARGTINLAEYKSCMLASLRSLLPKTWDSDHEVAWSWLWENVSRLLQKTLGKPQAWERSLSNFWRGLSEEQKFEMRKDVYVRAFASAPNLQDHFKQSDTRLHFVAGRIMDMTVDVFREPIKMVDTISAIGLRHVGYGIPIELIGPLVGSYCDVVASVTSDEVARGSFSWSIGLISKILSSTIKEGSTIVMKAINVNSGRQLRKAIACAPRRMRASWMLMVQVGSQDISPLAWAIQSGSLDAGRAIIEDLLTIRADRERYYYAVDDLFSRHPDIIKKLCADAPTLVPVLLDGLLWRSRATINGMRRVNFYVKHMLLDANGKFAPNLEWVIKNRDPKIVCHAVIVLLSTTVWQNCAYLSFLYKKSWFLFTLLLFISSQSVLEHLNEGENGPVERRLVFSCRTFIYLASMTQLFYLHVTKTLKSFKTKQYFKIYGMTIPSYFENWQDVASFVLMICLLAMMCFEPILHCWEATNDGGAQAGKLFTEECDVADRLKMTYSIFCGMAMLLYYSLLIDLAVFSTRVSAYVLVCFRMLYELWLFILATGLVILAFASAISVIKHEASDFDGIPPGSLAFLRMVLRMYSTAEYHEVEKEPAMMITVSLFLIIVVVFLCNLLIAQLNCAYSTTYTDMLGFAILNRIKIIVETMPSVSQFRWHKFVNGLRFDQRLEFNEGDIGLAGGIQIKELASEHPTTVEIIKRFGGSTSPDIAWPEEEETKNDEVTRLEKMETSVVKSENRMRKIEKVISQLGRANILGSQTGSNAQETAISGSGGMSSGAESVMEED